ncbi:chemotaxis response regulator protein-glutamate methylesterase [Hyphomicrobium sp.]|uniref:protein-glutamate methylesterase/protein-glutamine glutaminase n=1 Tax=Hyphomicrobium sp. TaxID=82 RepID=UPI002E346B4B|nr:chemotaxis response regulator protein-glutamate methylesterase [Hyphomicrobium sp.]HEX2839741.1 chemotaxis response regulator protein-glutamate methylesterase [Hyphomicrobium sp.]
MAASSKAPIRVLIVDDSAAVRQVLTSILGAEPDIEVMATAADPFSAAEKIRREIPDVMILDIEMPRMDGLTFLRKIMSQRPIPVIICSSRTDSRSDVIFEALDAGAIEVIGKPRVDTTHFLMESRTRVCDAVRAAARAKVQQTRPRRSSPVQAKLSADVILPPPRLTSKMRSATDRIVCIGASTGGTEALRDVLVALPADSPGIVIVQHMPEHFTAAFAKRLDGLCQINVREAMDGDEVLPGRALIAPGSHHMLLNRIGTSFRVTIKDGPLVSRHRPSVDVLFRSAAQYAGANALGILLTGMGDDGAKGLLEMKNAGAHTIAQNEATCVVFGMPKVAIEMGAAGKILPLDLIPSEIRKINYAHA